MATQKCSRFEFSVYEKIESEPETEVSELENQCEQKKVEIPWLQRKRSCSS